MNVHSPTLPSGANAQRRIPARRQPGMGDKRTAILNAATRVFARRGFFNAQVADVAREAGVAAGTVYLYFRSKDDLLTSIFEKSMTRALEEADRALAGVTDPVERLRRLARVHLGGLGSRRDLAIVFQVELRQSTKFMERFSAAQLRTYLDHLRDAVRAAQEAGVFRTDLNATLAAKAIFGALDEMVTNWVLSNRDHRLVDDADPVIDLLVNGMKAQPTV
ncbi:MAG: TetR/AcrR family transcriptional regulator [Acidobacteria bacterium]|nr:TetR/AcrR family transcriptional regulator [Acidobacteriota bacterium]